MAIIDLQYGLTERPPWHIAIILGFQNYLTMVGATIAIPLVVTPHMCFAPTEGVAKGEIFSSIFFVSGIVTLLQVVVGVRLPIVQGGTFSIVVPAIALLSLPKWKCPYETDQDECPGLIDSTMSMMSMVNNLTSVQTTATSVQTTAASVQTTAMYGEMEALWRPRMRELQGGIITASIVQVVVGATGLVGVLLRFIGPLTIAPIITLIGLALFHAAASFCAAHWGMAILTMGLIIIFSQYLRGVKVPTCSCGRDGCRRSHMKLFTLFPVILAMLVAWLVSYILTITGQLDSSPRARTDCYQDVIRDSKWFRVPYPGQWGVPTFTVAAFLGILAGVIAGMLESIGDYYACARLSGAPPPPIHAINRGIMVEGIGSVLSGLFGTTTGTTSYSENIGAIGITKVASRVVVICGALTMILLAVLGKFGALFVTIPTPVIGGVFMVTFGMIVAVGISNLQFVDLNSSRNLFVFGFATFFGLSVPGWVSENKEAIATGITDLDQIITVLLTTSMFLGGIVAFFLDNTIPGSLEERGITVWTKYNKDDSAQSTEDAISEAYDLPFVTPFCNKLACTKYNPVCPGYIGCACCKASIEPKATESDGSNDRVANDVTDKGAVNATLSTSDTELSHRHTANTSL